MMFVVCYWFVIAVVGVVVVFVFVMCLCDCCCCCVVWLCLSGGLDVALVLAVGVVLMWCWFLCV